MKKYHPGFEEFCALARTASLVPVYRQLVGDTLTPVTAFYKVRQGNWAFLFESVVGGERLGRYSVGRIAVELLRQLEQQVERSGVPVERHLTQHQEHRLLRRSW